MRAHGECRKYGSALKRCAKAVIGTWRGFNGLSAARFEGFESIRSMEAGLGT